MIDAALLYCMALSDIFAISSSMLTEFASKGRSPAGHGTQLSRDLLERITTRTDMAALESQRA